MSTPLIFRHLIHIASITACADGTKYEIVFPMDHSGSLDSTEWGYQRAFVEHIIDGFHISSGQTRVGVLLVSLPYYFKACPFDCRLQVVGTLDLLTV